MAKKYNLVGQKFGKLVVLKKTDKRDPINRGIIWECQCDCGNITYATTGGLNNGDRRSCGCYAIEKSANSPDRRKFSKISNQDGAGINHIVHGSTPYTNTSGCKGVTYDKSRDLWKAGIMYAYKYYTLVKSKNINVCIEARKLAEKAVEENNFLEWLEEYRARKRK